MSLKQAIKLQKRAAKANEDEDEIAKQMQEDLIAI